MTKVVEHLLVTEQCDLLSFGPVSESHSSRAALIEACRRLHQWALPAVVASAEINTIFRPIESLDVYLKSLSRNERKHNRRLYDLSLLAEAYDIREDVVQDQDQVIIEFERFLVQHSEEWQNRRRPGHFYAWPKAAEFHRALVQVMAERGRARFMRLVANGEVIAALYGFRFGARFFAELPARKSGAPWESYSLGRTMIVRALLASAREGIRQVDAGLGHYDHKTRLGGEEGRALRLHCIARRLPSRLRLPVWRGAQRVLFVLYQKLWYRRIRRRVPMLFRKPQARLWLRFDF